MINAGQPFCWWMKFTKVSNPFLPSPPRWLTWPLDVCGGVGYGWFYWFSLGKNVFSNLSGVRTYFLTKSVRGTFFLKSPVTPSKVKWSAPRIHQTFGQLTNSDLSIISKGFWNNRGQKSLGERGGICFYLPPLPGESVRTHGDVIIKFSQMDSLPNLITHGAPLRAPRARGGSANNVGSIKMEFCKIETVCWSFLQNSQFPKILQ